MITVGSKVRVDWENSRFYNQNGDVVAIKKLHEDIKGANVLVRFITTDDSDAVTGWSVKGLDRFSRCNQDELLSSDKTSVAYWWIPLEKLVELKDKDTEKCSAKNKDEYPEAYWIEEDTHDAVNHPSHYCQDGIECIDVIKATTKGMSAFDAFCQGNAMKYLFRWQFKNGAEDLKKARWYIDKLIEEWDSPINKKKE